MVLGSWPSVLPLSLPLQALGVMSANFGSLGAAGGAGWAGCSSRKCYTEGQVWQGFAQTDYEICLGCWSTLGGCCVSAVVPAARFLCLPVFCWSMMMSHLAWIVSSCYNCLTHAAVAAKLGQGRGALDQSRLLSMLEWGFANSLASSHLVYAHLHVCLVEVAADIRVGYLS
jgi:hypothetical protein